MFLNEVIDCSTEKGSTVFLTVPTSSSKWASAEWFTNVGEETGDKNQSLDCASSLKCLQL